MTRGMTLSFTSSRTPYPTFDNLMESYEKKMEIDLSTGERSTDNEKGFLKLMKEKGKKKK